MTGALTRCLSKRNAKEAVIERQPLDELAMRLEKNTYKVLKFWRVGEDGTKKPKNQDLRKSVMLAVGRVHLQQRIRNKEDDDDDELTDITDATTPNLTERPPSTRPTSSDSLLLSTSLSSKPRSVKFGASSQAAIVDGEPGAPALERASSTATSGSLMGFLLGVVGGGSTVEGRTSSVGPRQEPLPGAPPSADKLTA